MIRMFERVRHLFCLKTIFVLCFVIENTQTETYYAVNDRYPVVVAQFRTKPFPSESKGSTHDNLIRHHEIDPHSSHDLIQNDGTEMQNAEGGQKSDIQHLDDQNTEIRSKSHRVCVKCPKLITAVAREGLDGVLIEPPAPLSCKTNLPFSSSLYRIETLFGPELSFVLPEGRHNIIGKIRNVETGLFVRSCLLKYNVIVRRCRGYPHVTRNNIKMSCTAGTIWGSVCAFQCKNDNAYLSHNEPVTCNDTLKWDGHVPECINENEHCARPAAPSNGEYLCESKNGVNFASGTVCRVRCRKTYSIPVHLYPMSVIECQGGAWNSTAIEICYKEAPKRRYLSRRHRTRHAHKWRPRSHPNNTLT